MLLINSMLWSRRLFPKSFPTAKKKKIVFNKMRSKVRVNKQAEVRWCTHRDTKTQSKNQTPEVVTINKIEVNQKAWYGHLRDTEHILCNGLLKVCPYIRCVNNKVQVCVISKVNMTLFSDSGTVVAFLWEPPLWWQNWLKTSLICMTCVRCFFFLEPQIRFLGFFLHVAPINYSFNFQQEGCKYTLVLEVVIHQVCPQLKS